MNNPRDSTYAADSIADRVIFRRREDSEASRMIAAGQRVQSDMRQRIDQRHRDHRVATVIAVTSLGIIAIGIAVML